MTRILISAIATCVLLTGCESLLEPQPVMDPSFERVAPPLEFDAWLIQPGAEPPPLSVRGETGRIDASGALGTPVPCYELHATAALHGKDLTLEVVATEQPVVCVQVVANWGYEASIRSLEPGTYNVRVIHVHAAAEERGETVLEQEVEVR